MKCVFLFISIAYIVKEDKALFCDKNNIKMYDFSK